MKHIKTILRVATIAAVIVVGGAQNVRAECGYYSDAADCSQEAYPDVCTVSKQLRDLNGMSSTSIHPFPLLLGFARQQQVEVTHPKFTCSQNNSVCNMEAGAPKCYVFDTQNGTMSVSNEQPTFVPASVKLSVGPALNNDTEYTTESEALIQYKASAMAKIADGQPVIQNFDINAYTLPDTYTPPFIAQNAVYCKDHPQSDYCMIAMAVENNRLAINKIEGQYAMYVQDKSGKRFIKFNGDATKAEVAPLITNLTALHVPLVIKSALSSCAIQMETPPPDAYDPLNFNPLGEVMKTLGTIKSDAYLQNMDYCLPFGEKSDFPKPQCAGSSDPSPVFNPSADNVQLTVAQGVADAKTVLGVEKYDTLQCALEVLKDFQVTVYTKTGTVPVPAVEPKLKDDGFKMAMCQSSIFDCEKMVKIGDGKADSQNEMMMFLINGVESKGESNQLLWVMGGSVSSMFDPRDLKKAFVCKSDDAMLGMGNNADGSSKHVVWIDSVNDKTRVRIVNGQPMTVLRKILNDYGKPIDQQMKVDVQPPCDFEKYMKDAGLQDNDLYGFSGLPEGANTIADGVISDDKIVLLFQDKSDQTGVMKGVAVYDFSGVTPTQDYRQLPAPYFNSPKVSDRMVVRSLKDGGVELVLVKESDETAVRCVLPPTGGMTCAASTVQAASKIGMANLYDKASKGVKDSNFATQLLLMSQGESLDPMAALMGNVDLPKTTELLKKYLDSPNEDMKMKGDFIQAISGAIFDNIEGNREGLNAVVATNGGTLLMRKAEGKMFSDIIDNFPAASSCILADMDNVGGPDLLCIGSGGFYALPKVNMKPLWTRTNVLGTGTVVLEPLYKSQEKFHTFLWTLEQKVGDQWVDKTAMLSDRAVERPTLSFPNQTATELGSVTGVKTGKSVGTGTDALNNEVYRSTVTITDPGGLRSVGVNTFSVSSSGQVSGVTQLVGTSGETNPLGGAMQEVRPADVVSSWFGAAEGGCSVLPNAPSSNFFWILVIPAFMTRVMRAAYRRK